MLRLRSLVAAALLLVSIFVSLPAWGDEARVALPLVLVLHGDELPREKIRDAIARELGREVVIVDGPSLTNDGGIITVTYRAHTKELAVTWDGPQRGTVSRVVPARTKTEDVISDAAMLAGNLARDEAADLVAPPPPPAEALPELPRADPSPTAEPLPLPPPPREKKDQDFAEANVSFLYPLATNNGRPWIRTRFDINVLHGRVGQLDGVQIGGVNVVAKASGRGTGDVSGLQLGWLGNIATNRMEGVQFAWLGNHAGLVEGWQGSWVINHASESVNGFQTAMGINVAGDVKGLQLSSLNVARDLAGAQIGFVNVGRKVDGVMFGLVNVADDVDGVPFGIVSVTRTGGVHPTAWASNTSLANLGLRLATKHTYTMPMASYHHAYGRDFYGAGFAIGGRITIDDARYVDTDIGFTWLYAPERSHLAGETDSYHEHLLQPKLRAMFGWRFAEHFGAFAGTGLTTQARLEKDGDRATIRVGPELFGGIEL